jgi:hypothetical protein
MLVLLALACGAEPAHGWLPPSSATHDVTITPTLHGNPEAPAVMMYADRDDDLAADVCLRVWGDGRWTVAEDERPGMYDRETASGRVSAEGHLEGLLDPFFRGARSIWRTEEANVWIDGVLVPVRTVRRAAEERQSGAILPYLPHIEKGN